ncbi:hypothetical protein Fmac_006579 [Flemingia macrophylla]|uniref:Late embryogenesis abundant protein LEA-2 subgroup domain-containing protein n=1 Tax=Flemingia macrophylla TaxID=520843 RepID=A0ABD1NB07_9FABA
MVGMLLIGLALCQRKTYPPTFDLNPPKFFLDSFNISHLKLSKGEWDVSLAISNTMNYSYVNIVRLEAKIDYEKSQTLVVAPQYTLQNAIFMLDVEEMKRCAWPKFERSPKLPNPKSRRRVWIKERKEQTSGSVTFTMRIASMVAFRASSMSTRSALVLKLCNCLKLVLQNNTGIGALENGGSPVLC